MAAVTSKKVGQAVERNRVRRKARELYRRNRDWLPYPVDILMIAKKDFLNAAWPELREAYRMALQSIRERR